MDFSWTDERLRRFVGIMAGSFRSGKLPNEGVDGTPGAGKPGDQGDDGTVAPCAQL